MQGLRARTDRDFVGDLYNAFVPSAEFQTRVSAVTAAGCLP
jgi:hypothetical protein